MVIITAVQKEMTEKDTLLIQGRLNRWTSQLDLGNVTGGLEIVVPLRNST